MATKRHAVFMERRERNYFWREQKKRLLGTESVLLLFGLGDELWGFMLTILISTLIPIWGFAVLANRWLNRNTDIHPNTTINEQK